ncbi:MAG: hypothetical protein ACLQGP_14910, partial [Isosphaeraceae bacterium]
GAKARNFSRTRSVVVASRMRPQCEMNPRLATGICSNYFFAVPYLARRRTPATNAELVPLLGLSRPESVPNLTRRFEAGLNTDVEVREQLSRLEEELERPSPSSGK